MTAEHFDRQIMAAMEVALDRVCERWPNGGKHKLRKRVAQSIIRCAKTGNIGLDALIEAGEDALARPLRCQKGADIRPDRQSAA